MGGPGSGGKRTFDVDRLRLLSKVMPASEAAVEMGVSRQRIHQVAKREGIRFQKPKRTPKSLDQIRIDAGRAKRAEYISPAVTGGISSPIESSRLSGRIGEVLVAADLMARGWKVFFPLNMNGAHDLVAAKGEYLLSFEVKVARRKGGHLSYNKDRCLRSAHYALVVRGEPVTYDPELPSDQ